MLSGIGRALVGDLAAIDPILKHLVQGATAEDLTAVYGAIGANALLAPDSRRRNLLLERANRFELQVALEDMSDSLSLVFVDDQLAVLHVVAEGRHAAHPHALLLGCGDLVAHPLPDHLPFELGEGQQDVQRQPSHAGRGVELLRDRDERDIVAIEDLHQLGEVGERSRQAIDLVDNDDIDLSGLDIGHQPLRAGRSMVPPEYPPSS